MLGLASYNYNNWSSKKFCDFLKTQMGNKDWYPVLVIAKASALHFIYFLRWINQSGNNENIYFIFIKHYFKHFVHF